MKEVKHVFFDLDHTLWDYEKNARLTLTEMFDKYQLGFFFRSIDSFVNAFHHANGQLWSQYNRGEVDKQYIRKYRFKNILQKRADDDSLYEELSNYFIEHCSRQTHLIPGTMDTLDYLSEKYELSIITNGFNDSQKVKLEESGIDAYFRYVITSESVGYKKPSPEIFDFALELSGHLSHEVVMIGDNLSTDIAGAKSAGWKNIWLNLTSNKSSDPDNEIASLSELKSIL